MNLRYNTGSCGYQNFTVENTVPVYKLLRYAVLKTKFYSSELLFVNDNLLWKKQMYCEPVYGNLL